jgi:hypothetical protein
MVFVGAIFFCTTTLIVVTLLAKGFLVVVVVLAVGLAEPRIEMFCNMVVAVVVEVVDDVATALPRALATVEVVTGAIVVDVVAAGEITGGANITGAEVEVVTIGAKDNGAVVGAAVADAAGATTTPPPVLLPEPPDLGSSLLLMAATTAEKLVALPFVRDAHPGMS